MRRIRGEGDAHRRKDVLGGAEIKKADERVVLMTGRIELEIKGVEDRRAMAGILTANGYKVWVERQKHKSVWMTVVCAEKGEAENHA